MTGQGLQKILLYDAEEPLGIIQSKYISRSLTGLEKPGLLEAQMNLESHLQALNEPKLLDGVFILPLVLPYPMGFLKVN